MPLPLLKFCILLSFYTFCKQYIDWLTRIFKAKEAIKNLLKGAWKPFHSHVSILNSKGEQKVYHILSLLFVNRVQCALVTLHEDGTILEAN